MNYPRGGPLLRVNKEDRANRERISLLSLLTPVQNYASLGYIRAPTNRQVLGLAAHAYDQSVPLRKVRGLSLIHI